MAGGYRVHRQGVDAVAEILRGLDRRTVSMRGAGNPVDQDPIVTGAAGGPKVTVPGLVAGTDTDNGPAIQAVLDGLADTDRYDHSVTVWVEGPPGSDGVYINSSLNLETDRIHLHFASSVIAGPLFRVRIQGQVAELPETGKPILTADYTAGDLVIELNDVSYFGAGDYVLVRGARGATGDPIEGQKEFAYVDSVDAMASTITLVEGLDADYLTVNANPDSPDGTSPESQVTKVVAGNLTVDAARGDRTLTVHDTAPFKAGATVQVMDDSRTIRSSTGLPERDNFIHREMSTIAEVVSGTELRLEHALHHPCEVAQLGKVILINPVRGCTVTGARVRWAATSEVQTAFETRFGVSCRVMDCEVTGTGEGPTGRATQSWQGQAFRIADSLYCATIRCRASRPAVSGGGQGYGFTIYGSNQCVIDTCWGSGLRHTTLLFNSAAGNLITNCVGENTLLSDWDLHGCGCSDNLFADCISIGGDSLASNGDSNRAAVRVGNTAHRDGDYFNTFDGILVYGFHDGAAIDFVAQSHDNVVKNVTAINCQKGVRARPTPADDTLEIHTNTVENLTTIDVEQISDIHGGTNTVVKGLVIRGATFKGAADNVRIQNAENVELLGVKWQDPAQPAGVYAVYATDSPGFVLRHSDVSKSQRGVKLADCPNSRVTFTAFDDLVNTRAGDDAGGNTGTVWTRNTYAGYTPIVQGSGTSFTPDLT